MNAAIEPTADSRLLLRATDTLLMLVDAQERLVPAMHKAENAVGRIGLLGDAAMRLSIPILVTEQYPKGLGPTVAPLAPLLQARAAFEKVEFAVPEAPGARELIAGFRRRQIVLTGFEAHICVVQTAFALAADGYAVFVAADAVSSRRREDHAVAMDRLRQAGIVIITSEMAVFEWLGRAGTVEFKELSRLIK